jgi:hypothetical protein
MCGNHIYKDACRLARGKGLPSLIYHKPVLEVRFMRGAARTTRILTIRVAKSADRIVERSYQDIRASRVGGGDCLIHVRDEIACVYAKRIRDGRLEAKD